VTSRGYCRPSGGKAKYRLVLSEYPHKVTDVAIFSTASVSKAKTNRQSGRKSVGDHGRSPRAISVCCRRSGAPTSQSRKRSLKKHESVPCQTGINFGPYVVGWSAPGWVVTRVVAVVGVSKEPVNDLLDETAKSAVLPRQCFQHGHRCWSLSPAPGLSVSVALSSCVPREGLQQIPNSIRSNE
jgi:hypothetical protein